MVYRTITWKIVFLFLATIFWSALLLTGCGDEDDNPAGPTPPSQLRADCQGCHTNEAMLRATALPDSSSGDASGEG